MSHHLYHKWLHKVEIGIHHPQPSPRSDSDFWVMCGDSFRFGLLPFAPRLSEFGLIQTLHMSLTLPTSCHKYNEWLYTRLRLEFGLHNAHHNPFLCHGRDQISLVLYITRSSNQDGVCFGWNKISMVLNDWHPAFCHNKIKLTIVVYNKHINSISAPPAPKFYLLMTDEYW